MEAEILFDLKPIKPANSSDLKVNFLDKGFSGAPSPIIPFLVIQSV